MASLRQIFLLLFSVVATTAVLTSFAWAQGSDTIYDEAGVLSDAEEQEVQEAFDAASEQAGQPLYAFLVPDTGVESQPERQDLITQEAREANVPPDAGVIMVAPQDRWTQAADIDGVSEDAVSDAMIPAFQNGNFAAGLIAGAEEIAGEPVAAQQADPGVGTPFGGILLLLAVLGGAALLLRRRGQNRRRIEEERVAAEGEFANLTSGINELDEEERLVSGYLEAQRPLLDQRTEEQVEAKISKAKTSGFAQEFNEAAPLLNSDPVAARERMARGRDLLAGAMRELDEAEKTIDEYRAADEALDGHLRVASDEMRAAEEAEDTARAAGVSVEHLDLRPEYDRLAREAAGRAARRDEFDPRQSLAAVDALAKKARQHREALRAEIVARDALPQERPAAESALARARETLEEYRLSYEAAVDEYGPAALGDTPAPGELSSGLRHAEGSLERAARAESAGRFSEARALLEEAANLARTAMQAPSHLKTAAAAADRKKREGEEKLKELETRLQQAKANEHLMSPRQRQQLREYEYQLGNARYGFFGGDWLTALLLFEALDNDYMYMGDPSMMGDGFGDGGDWGGGDWGGGDWGGGDWGGGGDFGGGGW